MAMQPHTQDMLVATDAATALVSTVTEVGAVQELGGGTVTGCTYAANAAVTGAASPASRTLTLVNVTQASQIVATLALVGGVNLVRGVEKTIPLSGTPANVAVAKGDVLEWQSTAVGGTGLADPGGEVRVTVTRTTAPQ